MTAIEKIINFINAKGKPVWWKHCVRLAIEKGDLQKNEADFLFDIAKMEAGLLEKCDEFADYQKNLSSTGFEEEVETITITSISSVKNVASLKEGETLAFEPQGMTVIYGDNAAGKSSYSKILKQLCLIRGAVPTIKSNVFINSSGDSEAKVHAAINGASNTELHWIKGKNVPEQLKSVRVFDSACAAHYIKNEGTIECKPEGVRLLDTLIKVCAHISKKVEVEKTSLSTPINLPALKAHTNAGKALSQITILTAPDLVDAHCATQEEIDSLIELKTQLLAYQSKSVAELKKDVLALRRRIEPIKLHLKKIHKVFKLQRLNSLKVKHQDLKEKDAAAELLRTQTLSNLPIEKIGGSLWREMWDAAEEFTRIDNTSLKFPPKEGDNCPLCLQDINDSSQKKLLEIHTYITGVVQKSADAAKAEYLKYIDFLKALDFDFSKYDSVIDELNELNPSFKKGISDYVKILLERRESLVSDSPNFDKIEMDLTAPKWIFQKVNHLIRQDKELIDDESIANSIMSLSSKISEIEDRKLIQEYKSNFKDEINRVIDLHSLNSILNQTNTQTITKLSTEINQQTVIQELSDAFQDELRQMGFSHYPLKVNTRGSKGSQLFSVNFEAIKNVGLDDIASEGEQKCLALASFFAEIRADHRKSAIIFDDPVNSLDHNWRRKIAKRLAEESKIRQVIVFTHDLIFLKLLEEHTTVICTRALTKHGIHSGHVLERAPWDTLRAKERIKVLRQHVEKLKVLSSGSKDDYSEGVKKFYGKKREIWERVVEELLIYEVVQRFDRRVQTTRLRYLHDITPDDIALINDAMTKCSAFLNGHDSASEIGIDTPDIQEVEGDLTALDEYVKTLIKRRAG
ncbi:AAA family ATPase [Cellvibrio sp. UBA7661]|uniref:AAA family ATPase n=1 Tax=Cellvibrio sp. UBA7661 TaxID=1946311 RepID=UPI002F356942